jgi:hypothetical protein
VFIKEAQSTRKQVMKNEITAAGREPKLSAKGCVRRVPSLKKRYTKLFPVFRSIIGIPVSSWIRRYVGMSLLLTIAVKKVQICCHILLLNFRMGD